MNGDLFKWFPMVVAAMQLVILPLLVVALNAQIDTRVDRHNMNLYAHPALADLKQLEMRIDNLSGALNKLELAIERMNTRRRASDAPFDMQGD